jgi:recombinational DNA repair protein RecT
MLTRRASCCPSPGSRLGPDDRREGLPDPVQGNKVKAVRDYKGDAELVINAGGAKFIDAFNFYSNERFEHEQGGTPFIRHTPLPPAKRGALIGSYAVAIIGANLPPKLKVMYNEEIDEIRKKHSHEWKEGTLEQIPRHFYGPKTCVKQICKLLPTNPRLQKVMAQLDEEEIADADFEITGGGAVDEANASQELVRRRSRQIDPSRNPQAIAT